jgi:hypothetical protein
MFGFEKLDVWHQLNLDETYKRSEQIARMLSGLRSSLLAPAK